MFVNETKAFAQAPDAAVKHNFTIKLHYLEIRTTILVRPAADCMMSAVHSNRKEYGGSTDMANHRYEAFISYRHLPLDSAAAQRIEKALESYKIPRALRKKAGRARLNKCFRDRDELPLSEDLGESIEAALQNSAWLIVICTPELSKSKWCMREIDRFIELGKRDRIIPVLLKGEPEESYPEQLRFTRRGGELVEVEPLSADLRMDSAGGLRRKLRVEKLRIIARILGVGFDDLRRRRRERRLKLALAVSAAAVALLALFTAYALAQNARIERQRVLAATSESGLLVEKSLLYIREDRRSEAKQLALEAYDVSQTIGGVNEAEALSALAAASYAGDFDTAAVLQNKGMYMYGQVFSPDDRFIAALAGRTNAVCYSADTGEALWTVSLDGARLSSLEYSADGSKLLALSASDDRAWVLDAGSGEVLAATDFSLSGGAAFFSDDESVVLFNASEAVRWNPADGTTADLFDFDSVDWPKFPQISAAGAPYYLTWLTQGGSGEFVVGDLRTGELTLYQTGLDHGMSACAFSPQLDAVAVCQAGVLNVVDLATGELRFSQTILNESGFVPYWLDNGLILFAESIYDALTGELRCDLGEDALDGADGSYYANFILDTLIVPGEEYIILEGAYYRTDTGEKVCALPDGDLAFAVSHGGDKLVTGNTGADFTVVYALGAGTQAYEPAYEGELVQVDNWSPLMGSENGIITLKDDPAYENSSSYLQQRMYVTPDGRFAVMVNKYSYIAIYDLQTGYEVAHRLYGQNMSIRDAAFTADSRLVALAGAVGMVTVYDLINNVTVQSMTDDYGVQSLRGITFNANGDLLMVENHNGAQYLVYSVENGALLYRMHALYETTAFGFDSETGNAVVVYEDGSASIARIFSDKETLLQSARGE